MKHTICLLRLQPGLALTLLLALPAAARPDAGTVRIDLVSELAGRRLPFDVPFVLEGDAPPGTSRVQMQLRVKRPGLAFVEPNQGPETVSGTDSAGRFRLQVPAGRAVVVLRSAAQPGNTSERGEATIRASVPGTNRSATVKVEIVP